MRPRFGFQLVALGLLPLACNAVFGLEELNPAPAGGGSGGDAGSGVAGKAGSGVAGKAGSGVAGKAGSGGRSGGTGGDSVGMAGAAGDNQGGSEAGGEGGSSGAVCGDGAVDTGEDCDDENERGGDGCDESCHGEDGWLCAGEPSECSEINECATNPCLHGGDCTDLLAGFTCDCAGTGYTGSTCQNLSDDCDPDPCLHGGLCLDDVDGFTCDCGGTGYSGTTCESDVDDCSPNPCEHGGTCSDGVSTFTCDCTGTGYFGTTCETNATDCDPDPCLHGGVCTEGVGTFDCNCAGTGYIGSTCQTPFDDCSPNPCQHGGDCTDGVNSYSCDCAGTGYSGTSCQTDVDECAANMDDCDANATCANTPPGSFTCTCASGYTGSGVTCAPVDCGALTNPSNGSVSTPNGTTYGQTATYGCGGGYTLSGGPTRTCQENGIWTGSPPTCGVDANECTGTNVCTADYPCVNQVSSYTCRGQFADWVPVDSPTTLTGNGDGTVTDSRSGLLWQQAVDAGSYLWDGATSYCAGLSLVGSGWRLPTKAELESIVDFERALPTTDPTAFPDTPWDFFWSSSPFADWAGYASSVSFSDGNTYPGDAATHMFRVRCVRSSDTAVASSGGGGAPPGRYDVASGTVYDTRTLLTWQRASDTGLHTRATAISYCDGLAAEGGGWRLPNISELLTILDPTRVGPAIDGTAFPSTPNEKFWAFTSAAGSSGAGWVLDFHSGQSVRYPESWGYGRVRCVR